MSESYPAYAVLLKRPEDGGAYLMRDADGVVLHWWAEWQAEMWARRTASGRVVRVTVEVRVEVERA